MIYNFQHTQDSSYACSLQYIGDKIKKIEMDFPISKEQSLVNFLGCIHTDIEKTINALAGIGFVLLNEDVPNEIRDAKNIVPTINYCGIWVDAYKDKYQIKYIIKPKEAQSLKDLALEKNEFIYLIRFFFECDAWFAKTKDITTFVNNINEIRRLQNVPKEVTKHKFPNYWTKAEEQKYDGTQLTDYWNHLRSLGWTYHSHSKSWEAPDNSIDRISQNLHNKFTLK